MTKYIATIAFEAEDMRGADRIVMEAAVALGVTKRNIDISISPVPAPRSRKGHQGGHCSLDCHPF